MICQRFEDSGVAVRPWAHGGQNGLLLEIPLSGAVLKTMNPDPMALASFTKRASACCRAYPTASPINRGCRRDAGAVQGAGRNTDPI